MTTKLFSLAAREAKLDAAEDFPGANEKARQNALIYAYFQRYVQPKFSEEEAHKYFEAHQDKFRNFSYSRNQIIGLLRDQALTETNQSLMQQWEVKQSDDLLKDLDLSNAKGSSLVLARIGPVAITAGDLKELASGYPMQDFSAFRAKKELLDVLLLERLYRLAAEKAGLMNDPEVQKALAWAEDQLLAGRYMEQVQGKVTIEDARRYYQAHPEEFKQPDQIRLRQIVVATPEDAQAVEARLDKGDSFEEIAKSSSTDRSSAAKGGDTGWVRRGQLHPEMEKGAFQLKPKQISQPIKRPDGYYILRIDERIEGAMRPFDQVASNLLNRLRTNAVVDERQRLVKSYKVTINEQLL